MRDVSSKATKQAIMNWDKAFKDFFKKIKRFPKFKKKKNQDVKAYFPKNNKTNWTIERHRVKIPTISWARLEEFGYISINWVIKSRTVSQKADRYYISIIFKAEYIKIPKSKNEGIGIDLGVKSLVICSNRKVYKNIHKTKEVKKLERKLIREKTFKKIWKFKKKK